MSESMNQTTPQQDAIPGNAINAADGILQAYFASNAPETEQQEEQQEPERQPETIDAQPEPEDPETAAPEGEGEVTDYTLAELAEHLGVEPEALYAAHVPIDAETSVTIGSIKDEWLRTQKEVANAKRQHDAMQAQLRQQQQAIQQQMQMLQISTPSDDERKLQQQLNAMEMAESDQTYWTQLGQQDAGKAAMALQQLQAGKRQVQDQLGKAEKERQAKMQQLQAQARQKAAQQIYTEQPEWMDTQVRDADWLAIRNELATYGVDDMTVESLWGNPPAMRFVKDAVKLKQKLSNAKPEKKRVIGKVLKPGARRSDKQATTNKFENLKRIAKTGDRKAQIAAAKILMG